MKPEEKRAFAFFGACLAVSLLIGVIDVAGVHSTFLRFVGLFSLVVGIAVLLIRARQQQGPRGGGER
ncbi:MAG: hypothetical protein NVSMB51_06220 [Solirubrobacteraceae bacterium]